MVSGVVSDSKFCKTKKIFLGSIPQASLDKNMIKHFLNTTLLCVCLSLASLIDLVAAIHLWQCTLFMPQNVDYLVLHQAQLACSSLASDNRDSYV